MKPILAILALALVSGCASKQEAPAPALSSKEVKAEVDGWLEARARAEATKTHASGEHPAAQAEMDRRELALRDMNRRDSKRVEKAFREFQAGLDREKDEITQKMNRIRIQGRTLTPGEKKYVDETGPRLLEEIQVRKDAFATLLKALQPLK